MTKQEKKENCKTLKKSLDYKTLKRLLNKLDKEAQELINGGNSREKAEGYGMEAVIKAIKMKME